MIEVVAGIIQKDGKILIAKRKQGAHLEGFWEFPGGKIEPGETPQQSLERELQEEFGIFSKTGDFVGESIFDYGQGKTIRLSGYFVNYLSGDFILNDHSEIQWIEKSKFDDFIFAPADIPIISKLLEKI
jgi:mutator protein MutT